MKSTKSDQQSHMPEPPTDQSDNLPKQRLIAADLLALITAFGASLTAYAFSKNLEGSVFLGATTFGALEWHMTAAEMTARAKPEPKPPSPATPRQDSGPKPKR